MSEVAWRGKWLEIRHDGRWEYAARVGDRAAVVIVAIDEGHVVLVEQERVPTGRRCLELPAGLVGDEEEGETVEQAAARELEEETGYRAAAIEVLDDFYSSPGMTNEMFTLVRATGLTRVSGGGGDAHEDIVVHRVAHGELPGFVSQRRKAGIGIDAKLLVLLGAGMLSEA